MTFTPFREGSVAVHHDDRATACPCREWILGEFGLNRMLARVRAASLSYMRGLALPGSRRFARKAQDAC